MEDNGSVWQAGAANIWNQFLPGRMTWRIRPVKNGSRFRSSSYDTDSVILHRNRIPVSVFESLTGSAYLFQSGMRCGIRLESTGKEAPEQQIVMGKQRSSLKS